MSGIEMKNGMIVYYGNPAGYFKESKAIVDTMFQSKEFEDWLAEKKVVPEWTDGIFERLSKGEKVAELLEDKILLKQVRIWQLKPDSDFELRFRGYDEVVKSTGEPSKDNYDIVFDGELETNNLESIYTKFNMNHPAGFKGHSLSISDVVELYDENNSEFHYVDQFGFKKIGFIDQELEHDIKMGM